MTTTGGVQEIASSSSPRSRYHVFLSFRGEDTRLTFVDHLYTALVSAGLRTFRDDDEIERGEASKLELHTAIEDSRVSIVVFSRNYASSGWCLDELVMILGKRRRPDSGHTVLPVFYDVDPSEVRKQRGDYADAFAKHEERFKGGQGGAEWMEKLKGWREALEEAANLAGMVLQNQADGHEAKFIQKIVKVVEDKLRRTILNVAPYPIGLHSHTKSINFWLQDRDSDVRIVIISGMGGIGKTTIAKFIYNLNFSKFEGSSFLADIRVISRQQNGLIHLQRQLLSDILRGRKEKINSVDEGIVKIKEIVGSKRVLIVLDDVDKREQLDAVLGMQYWLSPGSKMVITTRHKRLLKTHEYCKVYRVEELDHHESLELFSWYAFGQNHPIDGYLVDSEKVVAYCRGLPLAIQTLGSSLSGTCKDVWRSQLQNLKTIPDSEIFEKLKLSYNSLQDDHDKDLFLDIACFFVGKDKDLTVTILDGCDYYTLVGIQNLIDRNLLTVDTGNKLVMHQLIQEMGREIVRQESPKEIGERSRLWNHKDSFYVLREKTGTRKIRGIILDMHFLKKDKSGLNSFGLQEESCSKKRKRYHFSIFSSLTKATATKNSNVVLEVDAFAGMSNLQLLHIRDVQLYGNYKNFPNGLRWLRWPRFPLQMIPSGFPLDRVVALEMPNSCLKKMLNGIKCLVLLKILDLSHSYNLLETPDFLLLPNLERLILENCTRLVKVNESIGDLERLFILNLRNCQNLKKLPKTVSKLNSLAILDISGCLNLENFAAELENMDSLKVLRADGTALNQLFSSTLEVEAWHLPIWAWPLNLRRCPEISCVSFPWSLVHLSLANCNLSDDSFPWEFGNLSSLQVLNLSKNPICSLPNCIRDLAGLQILLLEDCPKLKLLNGLRQNIRRLETSGSKFLEKISFESLDCRPKGLTFGNCISLVEIAGIFKLQPLKSVDAELINNLGLCNFGNFDKLHVDLSSHFFPGKNGMLPPQGLHDSHTFCTYLQASNIPMRFNLKKMGSSISFMVPSDATFRIQGLSVCSVYALSNPSQVPYYWSDRPCFHTIISNTTKHLKWSFCPRLYGVPEAEEDYLWLSYWNFEDLLEGGDEINVSIVTCRLFQVKEVGVHLVYKEAQEKKSTQSTSNVEVAQEAHPYGKLVPSFCNADCKKCKNYPVPKNPASTRVILLGFHPYNCWGCPEGYLVRHHARILQSSRKYKLPSCVARTFSH